MVNLKNEGKIGILFLGGAKRVSMGQKFIAAAKELGMEADLFSYELTPEVPIAAISRVIVGRKWSDPSVLEHLHECVQSYGIDLIVPFVDGAVAVAARYCATYNDAWAPVSDEALSSAMFDKIAADRLFRSHGLPVPDAKEFPLIAKPRFGSASKGIKIVNNPVELAATRISSDDYLVQEYISPREEITVDCYVAASGEVVAAVPRLRLETQGGEASVTETFADTEIESLASRTLKTLNLRGAVTIQMLRRPGDRDKSYKDSRKNPKAAERAPMLMEINPRLGGGAVCSVCAGANLPEYILRDCLQLSQSPAKWKSGIRICRYFAEVCFDMNNQ